MWSSSRRSSSTDGRSGAPRSGAPSRAVTSRLAADLLGGAHVWSARRCPIRRGAGSPLRFALPVALPPDGTYDVEVGPVHAGAPDRATVAGGSVRLVETVPAPWVRVAFTASA